MPRRSSSSVRVFYPERDTAEVVRTLRERLGDLQHRLPLTRAVLFGSYARGEYTTASDVDVLLVYEGEERPDAYALSKRILGISRLEPHLYTEDQYEAMGGTIRRMIEGGIPLL